MNKLVRDRIPEIMRMQGKNPIVRVVVSEEYGRYLYKKLQEEVDEFITDETPEEIADILEVLNAICFWKGFSLEEVERIRKEKADLKGGFEKRFVIEEIQ